jgi:hypothetical protein
MQLLGHAPRERRERERARDAHHLRRHFDRPPSRLVAARGVCSRIRATRLAKPTESRDAGLYARIVTQ